jgi:NAD-dependent SIR2 family protein deacetylase
MTEKHITGECVSCESSYDVSYIEELVSSELPNHCPFCGEEVEDILEEYIEDEDDSEDDEEEWDD